MNYRIQVSDDTHPLNGVVTTSMQEAIEKLEMAIGADAMAHTVVSDDGLVTRYYYSFADEQATKRERGNNITQIAQDDDAVEDPNGPDEDELGEKGEEEVEEGGRSRRRKESLKDA